MTLRLDPSRATASLRDSLYVSWPFEHESRDVYSAIAAEFEYLKQKFPFFNPSTLFFAGCPKDFSMIDEIFSITAKPLAEVTIETSPDCDFDLLNYAKLGINRLSLKIASFHDDILRLLKKNYSSSLVKEIIEKYKAHFEISVDLLHVPCLSLKYLEQSIDDFLSFGLHHVSIYSHSSTISSSSISGFSTDNSDEQDLSLLIQRKLQDFNRYQMCNFARAGYESKHALNYGRYGNWLGVGPGACSRISINGSRFAVENYKNSSIWLEKVREKGHGVRICRKLSDREAREEEIMMKLSLSELIEERDVKRLFRGGNVLKLADLFRESVLEGSYDSFRLSKHGFYRYDEVLQSVFDALG